jgi:hypothetical protein
MARIKCNVFTTTLQLAAHPTSTFMSLFSQANQLLRKIDRVWVMVTENRWTPDLDVNRRFFGDFMAKMKVG